MPPSSTNVMVLEVYSRRYSCSPSAVAFPFSVGKIVIGADKFCECGNECNEVGATVVGANAVGAELAGELVSGRPVSSGTVRTEAALGGSWVAAVAVTEGPLSLNVAFETGFSISTVDSTIEVLVNGCRVSTGADGE